jgi:hypothetical protein
VAQFLVQKKSCEMIDRLEAKTAECRRVTRHARHTRAVAHAR